MARKQLAEVPETKQEERVVETKQAENLKNRLKKLIPIYGQNKARADELKELLKDDNTEIKRICNELSISKLDDVDGWDMKCTVKDKHHVDEDKMIEIIRDFWYEKNGSMQCPYLKVNYCIDHDKLEEAIFNGDISDKDVLLKLKACDTVKKEVALTVSKVKEKK